MSSIVLRRLYAYSIDEMVIPMVMRKIVNILSDGANVGSVEQDVG